MRRLAWKLGRKLWTEIRLLALCAAVALGSAGPEQPGRPGRLIRAYGIVLPVGLLVWWAIPQITWVMSPSIDAWAVRADPGPIRRGDLVSFMLVHPLAGAGPVSVTKYALCLPGDRLDLVEKPVGVGGLWEGWYFCNDQLLNRSKPFARSGRPMAHFRPEVRHVPAGFIFVGSQHRDGFDSRYYGPVAIERLTRMERIL